MRPPADQQPGIVRPAPQTFIAGPQRGIAFQFRAFDDVHLDRGISGRPGVPLLLHDPALFLKDDPAGREDPVNHNYDKLYKDAIEPRCTGCHSLRGDQQNGMLAFSSSADFTAFNDAIIRQVYQYGCHPRSLNKDYNTLINRIRSGAQP